MSKTLVNGAQVLNGTIARIDLNTTTAGAAVITKLIAGTNVTITSTGVDPGTGDVTIGLSASASGVTSIFGRSGTVVKATGDYAVADITGAAALASPAFTGTPTAPTVAIGDSSTSLATTAFIKAQSYLTTASNISGTSANVTGIVAVANGGSGASTLTGILKGTGTTAFAPAVAADFPTLNQSTTGNAATVTTNANLTGAVTSVGNVTTMNSTSMSDTTGVVSFASPNFTTIGSLTTTATATGKMYIYSNVQVQGRPTFMTVQCITDLNALYSAVGAVTTPVQTTAPTIGTITLAPGVYDFGANAVQLSGTLTLTGVSTDYWIFKTTAAFATTATVSSIVMGGTATSANVFWLIGNNAPSFGASTVFRGTILNTAAIAVAATMTLDGRIFTTAGAISVGAGSTIYVPTGTCTVVPMGVLSTFLAFTGAGACATTSTVINYGDVGSANTAPATWALNSLAGNVYGPTTLAFRATYALYVNGAIIPYSARMVENLNSVLVQLDLQASSSVSIGQVIECRQQVNVGSTVVNNKQLTVDRVS